jgi:YidC/Oxa1 family membrane protein insertase
MIAGLFEAPASLLAWFYSFTHNYIIAISMIAFVIMVITAPLVLKSTKGMLEMQKLQPEMKRLQNQYRGDRTKLNEEMMKLYQEHKVNPLASCFPLLLQMPVFFIMFKVLHGLTTTVTCPSTVDALAKINSQYPGACPASNIGKAVFTPQYVSTSSALYKSLVGGNQMLAWGLDLSKRPYMMMRESFTQGLIYMALVLALGALYFVQQRMVASRAAVSPTISANQQKLMQYLPVVFAVFMGFYLTGLVIYYFSQAVFRIGLNYYITHRFYKGEESLGKQAQAASARAREEAKKDGGGGGGGGLFSQARKELAQGKQAPAKAAPGKSSTSKSSTSTTISKRVTAPKNTPTPSSGGKSGRPPSTGKAARPDGTSRPPKKK